MLMFNLTQAQVLILLFSLHFYSLATKYKA